MAKKHILAVCGTGGVTSSVINAKLRALAAKHGLDVEIHNCKVFQLKSKVADQHYDLIVSATRVADVGVPVVNGMAFLSGINVEETERQIVDILSKEG